MRQTALSLIASLIGSCIVIAGCAINPFERYYRPAASNAAPPVASRSAHRRVWTLYPEGPGKHVSDVLIGSSSFAGGFRDDFQGLYAREAVQQGVSVGATLVVLIADFNNVAGEGDCCVEVSAYYWK